MNEQIRQLLLEAQALAREQVKNTPEFAKYAPSYAIPGTEIHVGLRLSYEKFAELIVQQCADIGERYADGNYEVRNQILEHFGLEEPEE
jgi:hypothetical protein